MPCSKPDWGKQQQAVPCTDVQNQSESPTKQKTADTGGALPTEHQQHNAYLVARCSPGRAALISWRTARYESWLACHASSIAGPCRLKKLQQWVGVRFRRCRGGACAQASQAWHK